MNTTLRPFSDSRKRLKLPAISVSLVFLALAGCGGDDEGAGSKSATGTDTTPGAPTAPAPAKDGQAQTQPPKKATPKRVTSPEDQQGGAGDEEPARTQAELTGRGGRISPRTVRVPPYISLSVQLHSADRGTYELMLKGRRLRADRDVATATTEVAGLRPGRRLVARPVNGAGNAVVISATADPGP